MRHKTYLSLFIFIFYYHEMKAQTLSNKVVASGGIYSTASWGSLSATVGEPSIATLTSATVTLMQGFQQPTSGLVGITSAVGKVAVNVYPNPASNQIYLEVPLTSASILGYQVFDMNGKEIEEGSFAVDASHSTLRTLNISEWSPGMYLIKMSAGNESLQNIKIQILR